MAHTSINSLSQCNVVKQPDHIFPCAPKDLFCEYAASAFFTK